MDAVNMKDLPTIESMKNELSYCPQTGEFLWIVSKKGVKNPSRPAGCISKALGYRLIGIQQQRLYAHRIAWAFVYGVWPTNQVDHINGNRSDNRICNLRAVTHAENQQNVHGRSNKFGYTGVDRNPKTGRYTARVVIDKVKYNLGQHDTPEQAHAAYLQAKQVRHPFYVEINAETRP